MKKSLVLSFSIGILFLSMSSDAQAILSEFGDKCMVWDNDLIDVKKLATEYECRHFLRVVDGDGDDGIAMDCFRRDNNNKHARFTCSTSTFRKHQAMEAIENQRLLNAEVARSPASSGSETGIRGIIQRMFGR